MAGHRDWRTEMATAEVAHLKVKSNILEKLFDEPDRERDREASPGSGLPGSAQFSSVRCGSVRFPVIR